MNDRRIIFVDPKFLFPIESHDPDRVIWLKNKIKKERIWNVPLKIERSLNLIMDGHHRFEVAKALGLSRVPAEYFTYDEVEVWSLHSDIDVSAQIIFQNYKNGIIFPYKTAKHKFPGIEPKFEGVLLNELQ